MNVASDRPRRLYIGRNYDQVFVVSPPSETAKGFAEPTCSSCGRAVATDFPLPAKRGLRRPPRAKVPVTFSTSEITCTRCCPRSI
jgi:hypothetical protein